MNNTRFIALVGIGAWGANILRNLNDLGVLHTACDTNRDILAQHEKNYAGVCFCTDFDQILGDAEITAVVIATPAATHYELSKQALLAGKDVFAEKPLALKLEEGQELATIARNSEKILMVGHILRYHPALTKLQEMIAKGDLGKLQYIYSNRLNIGKLRTEENILWSFAPHDISVLLALLDEDPVKITATGGAYLSENVYDTTLTAIEFKNGAKAHIFVSWLHPFREQKLVVVGSKTMAVFDDLTQEKLFIYPHEVEWKDGKEPVAKKNDFQPIEIEKDEPLRRELAHFIQCTLRRITPMTDANEGLRVLKVLQAAEHSLRTGKTVQISKQGDGFFIHESCFIDENVAIGEGTKIWHFSHILKNSSIGKNCVIGQNASIGPKVRIGNSCKIQNNVSVYEGVTLEDEIFCGPSCVFTNVYYPRAFIERKQEFQQTLVKKGATIGANATIVCGVTIGRFAMIGAGSVVREDVPDFAIVAGVPAKQIGWACRCGVSLRFEDHKAVCSNCGEAYLLDGDHIKMR